MDAIFSADSENVLRAVMALLLLIGVAALISLTYWTLLWWFKGEKIADVLVSARECCPYCESRSIELLYGAENDYECFDCGSIWYV